MKIRTRAALSLVLVAGLVAACDDRDDVPSNDEPLPRAVLDAAPEAQGQAVAAASADAEMSPLPMITVYKSPTCGCCAAWVEHMREAGFDVETHDVSNLAEVKAEHGVPPEHQSCHTARAGEYVVEGHVPADLVRRLLAEEPDVAGLAVPGMPRGSPGMEVPDGTKDDYDVIAFSRDGSSEVYATR